jgi:serine/threonine-protein kinase
VSFLIFSIAQGIGGTDTVTVPDLQGMTEEEAESALKELNLELEISNTVTSYDFEEGLIASQEPRPESTVKEGYKVKVNISRGKLDATAPAVPNLEGKPLNDAVYELEWYKYVRGSVSYEANALPKDYVIRQTPAAGTESPEGSRINLVLSNGEDPAKPNKLPVPNLIELTADSAKKELESAGFKLGKAEEEPNSDYGVGKIFWQEYSGGTEMDEGIEIDVKISSGPEASAEPGSVSINLDYNQAAEEVFTLTVSLVDASGSKHDVIHEALRYKSNGGETVKVTGQGSGTIYVYFSGVQIMMYVADFDSGTVR